MSSQDNNPIKSFYFNLDSSTSVKADINSQIESLSERIEKIIDHFTVDDMPVIRWVLNMTHDKDTLKNISRALDRVADLVEAHDNLNSKLKIIEQAEKDPSWFAYAFGDFSNSFDKGIEKLFNGEND